MQKSKGATFNIRIDEKPKYNKEMQKNKENDIFFL